MYFLKTKYFSSVLDSRFDICEHDNKYLLWIIDYFQPVRACESREYLKRFTALGSVQMIIRANVAV